jgi:hypothetical protein
MIGDEFLARDVLGHGAYLCLRRSAGERPPRETARVLDTLVADLGLRNEFDPGTPPGKESVALLRRRTATPGDIADADVLEADAVVHVASPRAEVVARFCAEAPTLLAPALRARVLAGELRPKNYTGAAMDRFAYARAVVQQPAAAMPNAFFVPLSKTAQWWAKDWMERHTYFLPRYDDHGRMISEGHALATAEGIPCLLRRTYRHATEPAPPGEYDFLTYFECSDADVPTFHRVCAALRDVARNPEWKFVREGPTWHGRRVASWDELLG